MFLGALVALWVAVVVFTLDGSFASLLRFSAIFFTGTVIYLFRDRVPDSGWLAAGGALLVLLGICLPLGGRVPTFQFTPIDVFIAAGV